MEKFPPAVAPPPPAQPVANPPGAPPFAPPPHTVPFAPPVDVPMAVPVAPGFDPGVSVASNFIRITGPLLAGAVCDINCQLPPFTPNGCNASLVINAVSGAVVSRNLAPANPGRVVFLRVTLPAAVGSYLATLDVPVLSLCMHQTITIEPNVPVGLGFDASRIVQFVTNSDRDMRLRCLIPSIVWVFAHDKCGNVCDIPLNLRTLALLTDTHTELAKTHSRQWRHKLECVSARLSCQWLHLQVGQRYEATLCEEGSECALQLQRADPRRRQRPLVRHHVACVHGNQG